MAPTIEVVERNGEPVWRVTGLGICVENRCGARARELWQQLAEAEGYSGPAPEL